MATLKIKKKTSKIWVHEPSDINIFILSKFYIKSEGDYIQIVEQGGVQRAKYIFSDVEVYDIGGIAETFTSAELLMKRLEVLNYTGFFYDGEVIPANLISDDANNGLVVGSDGKLYSNTASENTFNLIIPKVTITRSATPLYYAQGLSGAVLLNNSTGLSDGSVLNSIGGITTTLFCIPYDCKLQVVIMHTNALDFDLSIWKSDNFANPTTNAVRIFQANTTGGLIENYAVASIDLQQGNLIQPFVKINTGSGGTNLGEIFLTFEEI